MKDHLLNQIYKLVLLYFCVEKGFQSIQINAATPINYWSFNGNYNDQIGAGNPTGGLNFSLTTDRFGNLNSAVDLSSGYLNLPNITFVNGSFSLLGWIYPTKLTSLHFLVSFARGNGDTVTSLAMWDNDRLLSLHNGGLVYSNIAFPLKCWSHIAQTVDSSGMSILYINGSVVAGPSNMGVAPSAIRNYNYIGTSTEYGKPNGNAIYDDIKIFNFALTSNQIVADFNSPNPGPATTLPPTSTSTTSTTTPAPPLPINPISKLNFIKPKNAWSFDNSLIDPISGFSILGGINYKFANDRSNNLNKAAIRLSHGYIQVPAGNYFSNNVFTITVWVKYISFDSKNEFTTIIDFGNTNQEDSVFLATSPVSNQILAAIFENTLQSNALFSKFSLNINTWYHVAYIFNGFNGFLYLNGNLVASATQFSPYNINRENCFIGKSNLNSSTSLAGQMTIIQIMHKNCL